MATPADQRLLELLDKWLASLELHLRYASLDEDSYRKVQPWVAHQRPAGWIVALARQKTVALKTLVEERIKAGDSGFADALEMTIFLANLVGSQHIERFIPLADAATERPPPRADTTATRVRIDPAGANAVTATREMPKFLAAKTRPPPPVGTPHVARAERRTPAVGKARGKAAPKAPTAPTAPAAPARSASADAVRDQVLADAARLMQWGRKWFELPELIARMADRPPLPEVRRILKDNKPLIDMNAGGK